MNFAALESAFQVVADFEANGKIGEAARRARELLRLYVAERDLDSNWALLVEKSGDLEMARGLLPKHRALARPGFAKCASARRPEVAERRDRKRQSALC
jgi:hypothetical protein